MDHPRRIGVLLFDGVEELDAAGPWEVLAWWTQHHPEDGWSVSLLSPDGEPVTAAKGMRIGAHGCFSDEPPLDLVLHPGGAGTRPLMADEIHLDLVRDYARSGAVMTSVCTGSLVFAAAGLLKDRPATTHWSALDLLGRTDPSIEVRRDVRFVDDGDVVTSAGVSAGIDMALHLVGRLANAERAEQVRHGIEYRP